MDATDIPSLFCVFVELQDQLAGLVGLTDLWVGLGRASAVVMTFQ